MSLIWLSKLNSYFLSSGAQTILRLIVYTLFGLLAAVIIMERTRKRAFLSGLLLSLMLLSSPLEYRPRSSLLAYLIDNAYILAPGIIFFIMASFADYAFHKEDRLEIWTKRARVLTVGLLILFLGLLGNRVYQYYAFISSAAYNNSISTDIPVPSGAQDVVRKIDRRWGQQIVTFTFPTGDKSMEIFEYYNDYCLKIGFSKTGSSNPVWQEEDRMRTGIPKATPPSWYVAQSWDNYEMETEAFLVIQQISDESENQPVQKVSFHMMPYPKKYRKWFQGAVKQQSSS